VTAPLSRNDPRPGWWWLAGGVTAALVGVGVALAVVRAGVRETAASRAYVDQPEYAVWGGLVLVQVPTSMLLGVASAWWAKQVRDLPPDNDRPLWQLVAAWLGAILAAGALLYAQGIAMALDYPRAHPDHQSLRVIALAVVFASVAAIPTLALWGVSRAAAAIDPTDPDAIDRFSQLWSRQRAFLGVLSLMLALFMLITAAKYQANNSFTPPGGPPLPEVPTTYLLVAGTFYGGILLTIYLPPYYATRQTGQALARALCTPPPVPSTEASLAQLDEKQRYLNAMGLNEGTREHLERTAVLLAPLITALITTLLPGVQT
jgi:hypothetical protein